MLVRLLLPDQAEGLRECPGVALREDVVDTGVTAGIEDADLYDSGRGRLGFSVVARLRRG